MTVTSKYLHSLEDFTRVININLCGTFNVSRLVAKVMKDQSEVNGERGNIVNVASIAGFDGQRGNTAYAASKGGVIGLTLPLARDLANYGIRVNTLAPGPFDTKMGDNIPKEQVKMLTKEILGGKVGRPEQFAHSVKFLVENTYMNAAVVRIDAGLRPPNI